MIQFEKVYKRYDGNHEALHNVSFTLERGEMAFLTGHSGAGKSTLLKLITMIESVSRGKVIVDGDDVTDIKSKHIPYKRRSIGMIFQNHRLLMNRSVFDNVALPLEITGYQPNDVKRRVRAALDKVSLLHKEQLMPQALSGGEQQRVGIARAVVNKPKILVADEPTGNLDPNLSLEIMKLFQRFNQVGTTVLIATHNLPLIAPLRNPIFTIEHGKLLHAQ